MVVVDAILREKCVFWLFASGLLLFLFLFRRQQFHKVVLVGGLSIATIVLVRLFTLPASDRGELVSEAYFLIAIGALYGIVWYIGRHATSSAKASTRKKG